ncbi:MAG: 16S rRNA (adenine(1518)-N(6)/adenine(1519)-N(6))-dimethyltransferase RsmA [Desertifilum sp.]|nr:16S rRNA (adenine(1518)-N(6)/adenine(1519)-N(6))-dimethyltransferase RsmA [Desertifilum sp.]
MSKDSASFSARPRKRFAQHWLRSDKALAQILQASELQQRDRILEIGPGTGILTRQLLSQVGAVTAVEIDRDLCRKLGQKLGKIPNFLLLQGDILELDLPPLLEPFPDFQKPNKVVANIPYNITGPILEKLLGTIEHPNPHPYELIVLLVQKEVAQRLVAQAGSTAFGALSVRVQYLAQGDYVYTVPARAFEPPPKVDSAIVRLRPHLVEPQADNPKRLSQLVKVGFSSKRKMLRNNLKAIVESDRLLEVMNVLNLNPQARAEDLSVPEWVALSNHLQDL